MALSGQLSGGNKLSGVLANSTLRGYSAYDIAVAEGFEGTISEWLETLKGERGIDGVNGVDGVDGIDGVTPHFTIGEVTTLGYGEDATVTVTGSDENPVLNFGVPRGASAEEFEEAAEEIDNMNEEIDTVKEDLAKKAQAITDTITGQMVAANDCADNSPLISWKVDLGLKQSAQTQENTLAITPYSEVSAYYSSGSILGLIEGSSSTNTQLTISVENGGFKKYYKKTLSGQIVLIGTTFIDNYSLYNIYPGGTYTYMVADFYSSLNSVKQNTITMEVQDLSTNAKKTIYPNEVFTMENNFKISSFSNKTSFTGSASATIRFRPLLIAGIVDTNIEIPNIPTTKLTLDISDISDVDVYGGTVDLVNGKLDLSYFKIILDGTNYMENATIRVNDGATVVSYVVNEVPEWVYNGTNVLSGAYSNWGEEVNPVMTQSIPDISTPYQFALGTSKKLIVSIPDTYTTIEQASAYLAENPLEIVYPLKTPVTYEFDQITVNTTGGINNFWSFDGNSTIEYIADTKMYLKNKTDPFIPMVASADVAVNTYFMVGGKLYYSLEAITQGDNLEVGTNCNQVSIADALNSLLQ